MGISFNPFKIVKNAATTVVNKANEVKNAVVSTANEVKDKVVNTAKDVFEAGVEKAKEVKQTVGNAVKATGEVVSTAVKATGEAVGNAAKAVGEVVSNMSASDMAHTVLGAASFIPGVGTVAAGLDAALYAAEGDYLNAALSAAAMIPGGKVVTTGGKLLAKGAQVVGKGANLAQGAVTATKTVGQAVGKYAASSVASSVAGGAASDMVEKLGGPEWLQQGVGMAAGMMAGGKAVGKLSAKSAPTNNMVSNSGGGGRVSGQKAAGSSQQISSSPRTTQTAGSQTTQTASSPQTSGSQSSTKQSTGATTPTSKSEVPTGKQVYGPHYDEAKRLHQTKPDWYGDPDKAKIVKGKELETARSEYSSLVKKGDLEAGHHKQGLAFGGENASSNIKITGESTVRRTELKGVDLDFYHQKGYGKQDAKILKVHKNENGIFVFGNNPAHTEVTTFQNKVLKWQRDSGLR